MHKILDIKSTCGTGQPQIFIDRSILLNFENLLPVFKSQGSGLKNIKYVKKRLANFK